MWITIFFLSILFIGGAYAGERPWFSLHKITPNIVLNSALIVLVVFTAMMISFVIGVFPQAVAAQVMAGLYVSIAGFFTGYAYRLFRMRTVGGTILYQHRSFWIDHAPALFAVGLIIYGFYRTSVLASAPVTAIRFTSGLSLICFGIFTWTLKAVPEFRSKGILFLDQFIPWKKVLSWQWHTEDVVLVEYILAEKNDKNRIKQFVTSIPPDEQKEIEMVLNSKMEEYAEERSEELMGDD